jgi:hypothetical protein
MMRQQVSFQSKSKGSHQQFASPVKPVIVVGRMRLRVLASAKASIRDDLASTEANLARQAIPQGHRGRERPKRPGRQSRSPGGMRSGWMSLDSDGATSSGDGRRIGEGEREGQRTERVRRGRDDGMEAVIGRVKWPDSTRTPHFVHSEASRVIYGYRRRTP